MNGRVHGGRRYPASGEAEKMSGLMKILIGYDGQQRERPPDEESPNA
jgi:hypothetical protein